MSKAILIFLAVLVLSSSTDLEKCPSEITDKSQCGTNTCTYKEPACTSICGSFSLSDCPSNCGKGEECQENEEIECSSFTTTDQCKGTCTWNEPKCKVGTEFTTDDETSCKANGVWTKIAAQCKVGEVDVLDNNSDSKDECVNLKPSFAAACTVGDTIIPNIADTDACDALTPVYGKCSDGNFTDKNSCESYGKFVTDGFCMTIDMTKYTAKVDFTLTTSSACTTASQANIWSEAGVCYYHPDETYYYTEDSCYKALLAAAIADSSDAETAASATSAETLYNEGKKDEAYLKFPNNWIKGGCVIKVNDNYGIDTGIVSAESCTEDVGNWTTGYCIKYSDGSTDLSKTKEEDCTASTGNTWTEGCFVGETKIEGIKDSSSCTGLTKKYDSVCQINNKKIAATDSTDCQKKSATWTEETGTCSLTSFTTKATCESATKGQWVAGSCDLDSTKKCSEASVCVGNCQSKTVCKDLTDSCVKKTEAECSNGCQMSVASCTLNCQQAKEESKCQNENCAWDKETSQCIEVQTDDDGESEENEDEEDPDKKSASFLRWELLSMIFGLLL